MYSNSKSLNLKIFSCNSIDSDSCLNSNETEYYLSNYKIVPTFIYSNFKFNATDFDNPFTFHIDYFQSIIIPSQAQTHFIDIQQFHVQSDYGPFYEQLNHTYTQNLILDNYLIGPMEIISKNGTQSNVLCKIYFKIPEINIKYKCKDSHDSHYVCNYILYSGI